MKLHANAALSWSGRRLLAERVLVDGWTLTAAAEAAGVSVRCARKWVGRFRSDGEQGLLDRSSAPRRVANRTGERPSCGDLAAAAAADDGREEIAETLAMPLSTVSAVLTRSGLGRLGRIGLEPAVRYERSRPGELVHIDVKKLGRIQGGAGKRIRGGGNHYQPTFTDRDGHRRATVGWEYVHIAVDDHSRLAYAEVLPDEKATTAIGFLKRALAFFARYGIRVERILTDNGSAYRATIHALACRTLGIRHLHTRPASPADQRQSRTLHPHPPQQLGLRRHLTAPAANAQPPLTAGSGTTTIAEDTQPSATNPRSAEPTSLGLTPSSRLGVELL